MVSKPSIFAIYKKCPDISSLTLLGMVGPFAIKLATPQLNRVGTSAGSIYAVSTVGSVMGTVVLGFFLFPLVGSRKILIGLGMLLLALAVSVYEQKRLRRTVAVLPCVLLAAFGVAMLPQVVSAGRSLTSGDRFQIRFERESLYGWVRVIDERDRDLRLLMADASTIGAARTSDGANQLTYQEIVKLISALVPNSKRALLLGQGTGHMAMTLRDHHGMVTDTVEIDPAVAEAASEYFGFIPTGEAMVGYARNVIHHLNSTLAILG